MWNPSRCASQFIMLWRTTRSCPVCLICGAPMAFRGAAGRAPDRKVEVWQCAACGGAGASFYTIRPAACAVAPASAWSSWLSRHAPWPSAAATRATIEQELAEAAQAIRHCRRYGDAQLAEVERRERLGQDATQARSLLATFRRIEAEHAAHRDRLLAEMAAAGRNSSRGQE